MNKSLKNTKGFTLVELLAVIVILALIMGIAIASMSGVIENARRNTMKNNAASIIDGVRTQVLAANMGTVEGTYRFTKSIVEKGGISSPFGGDYLYLTTTEGLTEVGGGVYKLSGNAPSCTDTEPSFVTVDVNETGEYVWTICMTAGKDNIFINNATETDLLASGSTKNVNIFSDLKTNGNDAS